MTVILYIYGFYKCASFGDNSHDIEGDEKVHEIQLFLREAKFSSLTEKQPTNT